MHHRTTYMQSNFQQNRASRSVKTVHTNLLAKQRKLHKFASCNSNFEKSRLSYMHYPISHIQANFGINRSIRYQVTAKRNYLHIRTNDRWTDGQTDGRTDGQTRRTTTIRFFFRKKKKKYNLLPCCNSLHHKIQEFPLKLLLLTLGI